MLVNTSKSRILSFLLAVVLVVGMIPVAAYARSGGTSLGDSETIYGTLFDFARGEIILGISVRTEQELYDALKDKYDTTVVLDADITLQNTDSAVMKTIAYGNAILIPNGRTLTISKDFTVGSGNPGSGTGTDGGHIYVRDGGRLVVSASGKLMVYNELVISAGGEMSNHGGLNVHGYGWTAQSVNDGTITVEAGAKYTTLYGMAHSSGSKVIARSDVQFGNVANNGPETKLNGRIEVYGDGKVRFASDGMENDGYIFVNAAKTPESHYYSISIDANSGSGHTATFTNNGTIELTGTNDFRHDPYLLGVTNSDRLINNGTIIVANANATGIHIDGRFGDGSGAQLINEAGGLIEIKNAPGSVGIEVCENGSDEGANILVNKGTIDIDNNYTSDSSIDSIGILIGDRVENTGTISNNGSIAFYRQYRDVKCEVTGTSIGGKHLYGITINVQEKIGDSTSFVYGALIKAAGVAKQLRSDYCSELMYFPVGTSAITVSRNGYHDYSGSVTVPGTMNEYLNMNRQVNCVMVSDGTNPKEYSVTYEKNGGTYESGGTDVTGEVPVDSNLYGYSDAITVLGQGNLARPGFTFGGWATSSYIYDDTVVYGEGDTYILDKKQDVTFYAVWDDGTSGTHCTVQFNSMGGSHVESQRIKIGEVAVKPADPVKGKAVFKGWYTGTDFETTWNFSDAVTGGITLYALWEGDEEAPVYLSSNLLYETDAKGAVSRLTGLLVEYTGERTEPLYTLHLSNIKITRNGVTIDVPLDSSTFDRTTVTVDGATRTHYSIKFRQPLTEQGAYVLSFTLDGNRRFAHGAGGNVIGLAPSTARHLYVSAGTGGGLRVNPSGWYGPGSVVDVGASTDSGYTFGGWTAEGGGSFENAAIASTTYTFPKSLPGDIKIKASFDRTYYSGTTDSGSSSGGGYSGPAYTVPAGTSANVQRDGSVSSSAIRSELNAALAGSTGETVSLRTRNAGSISSAILKSMAATAKQAGRKVVLNADTMSSDGKRVQGRLYVEPEKLSGLDGNLKPGIFTESPGAMRRKAFFEKHFDNKVAVVSCQQQGTFGARLRIAAGVDLSGLNTKNLIFYSYDRMGNAYTLIENPDYYIDANGFLQFYTEKAGDIIITDRPLAKKQ